MKLTFFEGSLFTLFVVDIAILTHGFMSGIITIKDIEPLINLFIK